MLETHVSNISLPENLTWVNQGINKTSGKKFSSFESSMLQLNKLHWFLIKAQERVRKKNSLKIFCLEEFFLTLFYIATQRTQVHI